VRSLSFNVVAWFGALLLFSFVACVAVTAIAAARDGHRDRMMNAVITLQADGAASAYDSGGGPALERYLAMLNERFLGKHHLANVSGKDVLTATVFPGGPSNPGPPPLFPLFLSLPKGPMRMQGRTTDGRYVLVIETIDDNFRRPNVFPYYFAVIAAVLLVCYALALTMVRPLTELRRTLSAFGQGDLSARTGSARRDEFGDVGRAFDAMADRLQTLLNAERRLLQDISHELNSPLARLTFAVELARTAPDRGAALDRIKKEAVRISEMVTELIEMTRVEGDPESHAVEDVPLTELLNLISEDCCLEADARPCRIHCEMEEELSVQGDAVLLRRGIENIVRNAIQYAPPDTTVDIKVRRADGSAEIAVRDYGPGVPPEHLHDIFRPFFRVANDRSRSSGGVGLGLAIVQRVVNLHHGRIAAENAAPGLRVTVLLPLALKKSLLERRPEQRLNSR
jgi:signal transduction histidine kinase